MTHSRLVLLIVSLSIPAGCKLIPGGTACTTEARAAISVDVRDSLTNLRAQGARIIARDGAFADTARHTESYDGPYGLAHEREGTYTVSVDKQGYRQWQMTGVRVRRDECHVRTVDLSARLQPAQP